MPKFVYCGFKVARNRAFGKIKTATLVVLIIRYGKVMDDRRFYKYQIEGFKLKF